MWSKGSQSVVDLRILDKQKWNAFEVFWIYSLSLVFAKHYVAGSSPAVQLLFPSNSTLRPYSLVQWNWLFLVTGCTWVTCISDVRGPISLHQTEIVFVSHIKEIRLPHSSPTAECFMNRKNALKKIESFSLRQDPPPPIEAILVIFGHSFLIFFRKVFEIYEKWHHFCAHAQQWSRWRRRNVEKRHPTSLNLTF